MLPGRKGARGPPNWLLSCSWCVRPDTCAAQDPSHLEDSQRQRGAASATAYSVAHLHADGPGCDCPVAVQVALNH